MDEEETFNSSTTLPDLLLLCTDNCEFQPVMPATGLPLSAAVTSHLVPGVFFIILSIR
jgi:hypothetical protein